MALIVSKFGGSSVRDATAIKNCIDVLRSRPSSKVVVVSALFDTTNCLEKLASLAMSDWKACDFVYESLLKRHLYILSSFSVEKTDNDYLENIFSSLKENLLKLKETGLLTLKIMDEIYSIGEYASSYIFSIACAKEYKGRSVTLFNIQNVLITDSQFAIAAPQFQKTQFNVNEHLIPLIEKEESIVITQGFIGINNLGETTTLGREGSDYTATILGHCLNASQVNIWTDVNGIFTCDPNLNKDAMQIEKLSYDQANMMAMNGAKVLFAKTLGPLSVKNIPLYVGNTFNSNSLGTYISYEKNESDVYGVILNKKTHSLTILGNKIPRDKLRHFPIIEEDKYCIKINVDIELMEETLRLVHSIIL